MSKQKTRKSLVKRFKITKTGKIMRRASGQDHLRGKKSGKAIRSTRKWVEVEKSMAQKIKKLMK